MEEIEFVCLKFRFGENGNVEIIILDGDEYVYSYMNKDDALKLAQWIIARNEHEKGSDRV